MAAYRSMPASAPEPGALEQLREGTIDIVTFTSSATACNLVTILGGDLAALQGTIIACIGPVTAETVRSLGIRVDVVAKEYTIQGLVEAIVEQVSHENIGGGAK